MGLGNMLVLAQVIGFLMSFIFSFFIFIPVWVNQNDFKGHCPLYSSGTWKPQQSSTFKLDIDWGPQTACNFTIFLGVVVMIVSAFYLVWNSRYLCFGNDSSWIDAFVACATSMVMMIVIFSTALTVSIGFREWCTLLIGKRSPIESCETGQYDGMVVFTSGLVVDTDNYYSQYEMSQFGLWTTWICWLILSFLACIKLYRYHKQEAFLTSMHRERERLLQRVGHSSSGAL